MIERYEDWERYFPSSGSISRCPTIPQQPGPRLVAASSLGSPTYPMWQQGLGYLSHPLPPPEIHINRKLDHKHSSWDSNRTCIIKTAARPPGQHLCQTLLFPAMIRTWKLERMDEKGSMWPSSKDAVSHSGCRVPSPARSWLQLLPDVALGSRAHD